MKDWKITHLCSAYHALAITCDNNGSIFFLQRELWQLDTTEQPWIPKLLSRYSEDLTGLVYHSNNLYSCDSKQNMIIQFKLNELQWNTFAGNGTEGSQDGPLEQSSFCRPHGIAVDSNGDLYVTDDHHIRKILMNNKTVETIAGSSTGWGGTMKDGNALESKFNNPIALTITKEGIIYVCDTLNRSIRKICDGIVSTVVGNEQLAGNSWSVFPSCVTLNNDGSLLVLDYGRVLRKVDPTTGSVKVIEIPEIEDPRTIARDSLGNFYVATNRAIFKIEDTWLFKRWLWIGKLKEDASYCQLASLPSEIVWQICEQVFPMRTDRKRSAENENGTEDNKLQKISED